MSIFDQLIIKSMELSVRLRSMIIRDLDQIMEKGDHYRRFSDNVYLSAISIQLKRGCSSSELVQSMMEHSAPLRSMLIRDLGKVMEKGDHYRRFSNDIYLSALSSQLKRGVTDPDLIRAMEVAYGFLIPIGDEADAEKVIKVVKEFEGIRNERDKPDRAVSIETSG